MTEKTVGARNTASVFNSTVRYVAGKKVIFLLNCLLTSLHVLIVSKCFCQRFLVRNFQQQNKSDHAEEQAGLVFDTFTVS